MKHLPASHYPIDQCSLYRMRSKRRLAEVLFFKKEELVSLRSGPHYKLFTLKFSPCPFTGKITKDRKVQEPKYGLKQVHQRIQSLLSRVEPPSYAHGAIAGRSYKSNAEAHVGLRRIATFDIKSFYPSTSRAAVFDFFKSQMDCADDISGLLTDIICYGNSLPTGSSLSPLMSVFANKKMFDELEMLAKTHKLTFTVYIDDITYSGFSLPRGLPAMVKSIVEKYNHTLAAQKTAIFRRNQAKHVTGVVINLDAISVPNSRFFKARKIQESLRNEKDVRGKFKLSQKLAGLLGEAAHLDKSYQRWANASYKRLSAIARLVRETPVATLSSSRSSLPQSTLISDSSTAPF